VPARGVKAAINEFLQASNGRALVELVAHPLASPLGLSEEPRGLGVGVGPHRGRRPAEEERSRGDQGGDGGKHHGVE